VPGSVGTWGWSGSASTSFWIDRSKRFFGILLLQHLPNGAANDLPRIARPVQALVNQDIR
jgi:CubicO group peptidase (beta-lactamase class C family)